MRLALLFLPLLAPPAFAAGDWVKSAEVRGAQLEYDRASIITREDGTKRILVRMTASGFFENKTTGGHYDHTIAIIEFDCPKKQRRFVDVVSYFRAERVDPGRTSDDWKDVGRSSGLYKAVCG